MANVNHKVRMDCPVCSGRGTLTITKEAGKVKYNCFKAACTVRGIIEHSRSLTEIRDGVCKVQPIKSKPFVAPDYLIHGFGNMEFTKWAKENHVIEAYESCKTDISYDPRLDRMVFQLRDLDKQVVGLVGRKLIGKPKWFIYPNTAPYTPFKCGHGDILVLVEDCASACSVSRVEGYTGMALLGTDFHAGYVPYIRGYKEIIICLDNDAKRKAVNNLLKRMELLSGKPVRMLFSLEDLKKLSLQELKSLIYYVKN